MNIINIKLENNVYYIEVNGEVDAQWSIQLDDALIKAKVQDCKKVAVDLTEMSYISSAGLGVFISHLDDFKSKSIDIILFGARESVKHVFDILGLDKILTMVSNKKEMLNKFQ